MWELFEQRLAAEHYLRPAVTADALLRRLATAGGPDGDGDAAFSAALPPLSYTELRAVYARLIDLTGGPAGQPAAPPKKPPKKRPAKKTAARKKPAQQTPATQAAARQAPATQAAARQAAATQTPGRQAAATQGAPGWWPPYRDRLAGWRLIAAAAVEAAGSGAGQLTEQDLPSVAACAPIDERIEDTVRRVFDGQAGDGPAGDDPAADGPVGDGDVAALTAAVRDYRQVGAAASVSAAGRHLIGFKIARALDSLGRACELLGRDAAAETHFGEAADAYAEIAEPRLAAASAERREAAAQRRVLDADGRLMQFTARLDTAPAASADRAAALAGLAELAHEHGDVFEARKWLARALAELTAAGAGVPAAGETDRAVADWISALPAADDSDPMSFLRRIATLLTLHCQVAVLRIALTPDAAGAAADLDRLVEIITEMPAHAQAVQDRLEAQLSGAALPSDEPADDEPARAETTGRETTGREPAGEPPDLLAVMRSVNELLELTENTAPDGPETLNRWRQLGDETVLRARALGQPVTVAQALEVRARVELAGGDPAAAVGFFEAEFAQVAGLGGQLATDQAIIAQTSLARIQLARGDTAAASAAAGTAIGLIERDRYRVSAPFQQAALLAAHADVFTAGIFAAWQLGDHDLMLARIELAKARASVRQLLLARPGPAPDAESARLEAELAELGDAIHRLDPVGPDDPEQARQAQEPLREERRRRWDLRAIARRDPGAEVPGVTVAAVQAALEPDEAVLSYYWLRPLVLLVVTITAEAVAVERKVVTAAQRALLVGLIAEISALTGPNLSLDAAFIEPLAEVLTPAEGLPLLAGRERLIVSPHQLLHWYPFAAMPFDGQPLVRSFALRQVPNLTSLLAPPAAARPPRIAALAVSQFPGRPELGPLPGVAREAADIAAIYAAAGVPATVLREPTRAQVLAALRDGTLAGAWCLELATHGHNPADRVSLDAPLETMLELADGSIDGYEIAAAGLGCEVVALAACYGGQLALGGRGRAEQPGDELFGLPAAFLESGCRNLMAATWPASEATAPGLLAGFHRHLAGGAPADIALARAQREYLDGAAGTKRRAYYWAPFHVRSIGRPAALDREKPDPREETS